jgi:tight adherence protein C
VSVVVLALFGVVAIGAVGVGVVIAAALLTRALGSTRAARRQRALLERGLPDAMDRLVLGVRAGLTPSQAVRDIASSSHGGVEAAFAEVVRRTERGQPFADALAALPELLGANSGGLADVIATSDRHGLPLGPVLDQLTLEVRATRRRLDQAAARTLPVRLSFPLVMCTLPSFVLLAIAPAVIAALSSLGATAW